MANKTINNYTSTNPLATGDFILYQRSGNYLRIPVDELIAHLTSDNLTEGVSNLWFSNERAQDAVGGMATSSDGITLTYSDGSATLTVGTASNAEIIYTYTKVFDQSEIIALNSTPVAFAIPTVADKCLIPISAFVFFDNQATTPFANADLVIRDRTSNDAIFEMSNAFLNTSEATKYGMATKPSLEAELTVNTDLQLYSATSNPTGGGSGNRVVIQIKYQYSPDVTGI